MGGENEESGLDLMLRLSDEFDTESDRASAVLAAAYLDGLLAELITAAMPVDRHQAEELLYRNGFGPLSSFSARIDAAYCLGLVSQDEHSDLNSIRKTRNDFAHELIGLSFDSQSIADRCRDLKGAQVDGLPSSPRECFKKAAVRLMVDIIVRLEQRQHAADRSGQEAGGHGASD